MTLIITEISDVGIAMAADSMISYPGYSREPEYQQKLFKVPKISGGAAYWGSIGLVIRGTSFPIFSDWLRAHITVSQASSLKSFAEDLAYHLNASCNDTPLPKDKSMGVHVAGYDTWDDGRRRPTFYHIHNGHLHTQWNDKEGNRVARDPTGDALGLASPRTEARAERKNAIETLRKGEKIYPKPVLEKRELFKAHRDFPREGRSIGENEAELRQGYATKNGDPFLFSVRQQEKDLARWGVPAANSHTYPGDPNHSVPNTLQRLLDQFENVVGEVAFRGLSRTYGGPLWKLGINESGYLACDKRFD